MDENVFRLLFEAQSRSSTLKSIWRDAYGDDYPDDADPASFVTQSDLHRLVKALDLSAGSRLVDVGCGVGGPGAHVARATGAQLIGIDPVSVAVELARERQLDTLADNSTFQIGEFASTGLPDLSADAIMSTDALLFAPDYQAAFTELARILASGGSLAFTTFELRSHSASLNAGAVPDYRPYMEAAGFALDIYEESPDWEPRMRRVFAGIRDHSDQLYAEMGETTASLVVTWATLRPPELSDSRRVFVSAQKSKP